MGKITKLIELKSELQRIDRKLKKLRERREEILGIIALNADRSTAEKHLRLNEKDLDYIFPYWDDVANLQ